MRLPNWPALLYAEIDAWRSVRFEWGTADCCQFVRRVAFVLTGEDRGAVFTSYDREIGALRLIAQHGGMEGLLRAAFGDPIEVAHAQRGCVVLADFGRGLQPSICLGAECVAPGETGLVTRPTATGVMAWKV